MTLDIAPASPDADQSQLRVANRTNFDQSQWFLQNALLVETLDGIPDIVLVLNPARQVIFANQALMDFVGANQRSVMNGLRPGDVFECVNVADSDAICGTTRFCQTCGAARAILSSLRGVEDTQECRILQQDGTALDLRVTVKPLEIEGQRFTLFTLQDISHLKRQLVLERLFFHDILNTAGLIKGYADIIDIATPEELEIIKSRIKPAAARLVNEIEAQQLLNAAENDILAVQWLNVDACALLQELQMEYEHHETAAGRSLQIEPDARSLHLISDPTLMGRVLSNLIKNALEASAPGQIVTLSCALDEDSVVFAVHNESVMPNDVQLQVFQRSFSTKGRGRGVGTYSAKLLTERYLCGKISFSSRKESGTIFTVRYPLQPLDIKQAGASPDLS